MTDAPAIFTARVQPAGETGGSDFVEVSTHQVPQIGDHGELILVERDTGLTRVYSPNAWFSYAYPTPKPEIV
jgi:hypothetical protein